MHDSSLGRYKAWNETPTYGDHTDVGGENTCTQRLEIWCNLGLYQTAWSKVIIDPNEVLVGS
jgi:hypothetical protein